MAQKILILGGGVGGVAAAAVRGRPASDVFDGKGLCTIEVGGGLAMGGEGAFFEPGRPRVTPGAPDAETYARKLEWANALLERYL